MDKSEVFKEKTASQLPALRLLSNLNYKYLSIDEALRLRGSKASKVILEEVLEKWLRENNSYTFKGKKRAFSEKSIRTAVESLTNIGIEGLVDTNSKVYDLLVSGKACTETVDGDSKDQDIEFINFKNPEKNIFHVTQEFSVERKGSHQTRRPDIVIFVNGIPLVVIECKAPTLESKSDETPELQAISQHLRNQGQDEIQQLFVYSQILMAVAGPFAKYGAINAGEKFWSQWKEDGTEIDAKQYNRDLIKAINKPLSDELVSKIHVDTLDIEHKNLKEVLTEVDRLPTEQDKLIYSLLNTKRLLDIIQKFVVYDAGVKKLPRYQQYFAVKATIQKILSAPANAPREGGLIWHTTGSGKSLTMVMLAKALTFEKDIKNPKVVLVTDRVSLDKQIKKTFNNCDKLAVRATSGKHLVGLIDPSKVDSAKRSKSDNADVITTVIDKFESAAKAKVSSEDRDVFVLVDESHRSQFGSNHAKMKLVFPNACYIGFTGTPLMKKDKSTATKFGGLIHKYTMDMAIQDKAVTKLLYEGRISKMDAEAGEINEWFDRFTQDLSPEQKADVLKRINLTEAISSSSRRMQHIAYDVGRHFIKDVQPIGFKAMFATSSKSKAIAYQKLLKRFFPNLYVEVMMSAPDTREGNEEVESKSDINEFWDRVLSLYKNEASYNDQVVESFKSDEGVQILIVVDKLLTGFDAPINQVLYVDKPLKEHGVLQAIARTNRLADGKDFGLIIDYWGILGKLNEALDTYSGIEGFDEEDVKETLTGVEVELKKLEERRTHVWDIFKEVSNQKDIEQMRRHLAPIDRREDFYDTFNIFARTLKLALATATFYNDNSDKKIKGYKDDLKFFTKLRILAKTSYGDYIDHKVYERQILEMVENQIDAEKVETIIDMVDIFNVDFPKEIEEISDPAAKADTIAHRTKKTATEKMEEDPVLYQSLAERVEKLIEKFQNKLISAVEYLKNATEIYEEAVGKKAQSVPDAVRDNEDAQVYYRLVKKQMDDIISVRNEKITDEALAELSVKANKIIEEHKIIDWHRNQDRRNDMSLDIEDLLYNYKGRFNLSISHEEIEGIIEKLIHTAEVRDK
ncbi:type I restriction endonuclease subunit R [Pseudobacteriovorax antillogorgiicola]|uniref:Type I restriction enzyme endonuclease subunit n=1 Tax=Pseudobacteriovorax antillogorgiicola TaxID=1513793 RepID=A0A1Y6CMW2_9BACT|nr:HsdR family type I site-specific deoxyribonuclease [Pseudobacteriovorax antillogorgiicola]TCS44636.1 type I restriction enzyme R subunit [Pseudobacteriovorax antillogorgiicola]SMF78507.1 type I restriction enzyme, R subunit [Pseudobacteriovorax antillogorgiicola]